VGLTPERLTRLISDRREISPVDATRLFERLASSEGLAAQASTFGTAEVVKDTPSTAPPTGNGPTSR
jgi:hypothetical protein